MVFQHELKKAFLHAGDSTAIESGAERISYAQLSRTADAITRCLLANRIQTGARVGLLFENTVDLVYAMIGVANAGGVFVPLDPTWPENRLVTLIDKLDLSCVLTRHDVGTGDLNTGNLFFLDEMPEADERPVVYPDHDPSDPLYIYFTSGSTGEPKGIIGKNESLTQFIKWEIKEFHIDASIRVSQFISPYFDAFLRDVFVPLFSGGVLCIPLADRSFFTSGTMIRWIDEARVNLIHCVPSVFRIFKEPALINAGHFKELQYVLLSGEKVIPAELRTWFAVFDDRIQLVNFYGATETTLIKSFYRIRPRDADKIRIPIGSGIDGADLLVADANFRPCNALMSGDLYIVSDYMTHGYLDNPRLNEEKFVIIPTGQYKGKKAFRTGDKARLLPEGGIELLGRSDRQVKLRGIRVEPEEIENAAMLSGLLQNVAVLAVSPATGEETGASLVAFIIRDPAVSRQDDLSSLLYAYLASRLPAYMLPSEYMEVDAFPLLGNGKINYKELLMAAGENKRSVVLPANETEKQLLVIWKEILGKDNLSTDDSFNLVGGNSLAMMRLIARIFTQFRVRISLNDLFQSLTIRTQAAFINKAVRENAVRIEKVTEKKCYVLSSAQQRMYFKHALEPGTTAYNMPVVYAITGAVDADKLERTIIELANRHEAMRTSFALDEGVPCQVVSEAACFSIEDRRAVDIDAAVSAFVRPFDLQKEPLFRVALVKDDPGKEWLLFDIHHILCDGISQTILFRDFLSLYEGVSLRPLPISYKDYAEWEKTYRETEQYKMQKDFWLREFRDGAPQMELPLLRQQEAIANSEGGRVYFRIEAGFIKEEMLMRAGKGITEFSVLYAFFLLFVVQLTGQDDTVIGIVTAGRDRQQLEDLVGMFSKTLPVRFRLNPDVSLGELVEAISKHLVQVYDNQLFDLTDIQSEANRRRETHSGDLFEIMLVYQNYDREQSGGAARQFVYYEHRHDTAKYPLSLLVTGKEGQWDCLFEYSLAHFHPEDADRLAGQFSSLVASVCRRFDDPVLEIVQAGTEYTVVEDDISFNI